MHKMIRLATKKDIMQSWDFLYDSFTRKRVPYLGSNLQGHERRKENWKKIKNTNAFFILSYRVGNTCVGTISVSQGKGRMSHNGYLGYAVHPDYHRQGIGSALMKAIIPKSKEKAFERLELECVPKNKGSVRLAEKFGFVLEGRKRKAFKTDDGKYLDLLVYGKILT
jgi:RimJ/RimL family protein N-acetyltransferase